MRRSDPMPLRTASTSAPTFSQISAMSFMNEMRVASIAFAAYLVSSAERGSMKRIGFSVRDDGVALDGLADLLRGGDHVLQVGVARLALRGADRDEHDVRDAHGVGEAGG